MKVEEVEASEESVPECREGGAAALRYSDRDFDNHYVAPGRWDAAGGRGGSGLMLDASVGWVGGGRLGCCSR